MGLLNTLPFGNDGFSWEPQSHNTNFGGEKQPFLTASERGTEAAKSMVYLHRRETQLVYIATESIFQISKRTAFGSYSGRLFGMFTRLVCWGESWKSESTSSPRRCPCFLHHHGLIFCFQKPGRSFFFEYIPATPRVTPVSPVFSPPQQQLWGFGGRLTAEWSAVPKGAEISVPSRIRFENPYPSTKSAKKHQFISSLLGYFVSLAVCVCFFFVRVKLMFGFHLEV